MTGSIAAAVLSMSVLAVGAAQAQCQRALDAPGVKLTLSPGSGRQAVAIGVADFDGNGRPDLLASNEIFLDFARRAALPISISDPAAARITDLDHDGRPDIVAVDPVLVDGGVLRSQIVALVNDGHGGFTRVDTRFSVIAVNPTYGWGDFDGDGVLDVYVPGAYDDFAASTPLFLGNADGTFRREFSLNVSSPTYTSQWIAADLNGDHRSDLISTEVKGSAEEVFYYLRTDSGFERHPGPALAGSPTLAADFNGDGRDDVIFSGIFGVVSGGKIFFDFPAGSSMPFAEPFAITADFNGDGTIDLAGLSPSGGLDIRLNDGHGQFHLVQNVTGVNQLPLAADVDRDGIVDLVAAKGRDIFVIRGTGNGTFHLPHATLPASIDVRVGDLDGDGDDDLVSPGTIAWNDGDGTFRNAFVPDARFQRPVRVADIDGDGKGEVISLTGNSAYVLSVRPDGSIVEVAVIPVGSVDAAVGDFTGTHHPELALLAGISVRIGIQVFEIRTGASPRFVVPVGGETISINAADLNGDGRDDIIVGGLDRGSELISVVSTFLSTGTSFGAERRTRSGTGAVHASYAADFDGDGKTDVTFVGSQPAKVLYGDGNGGFTRQQDIALESGEGVFSLGVADFDGDHRPDLAVNGASAVYFGAPGGLVEQARYFAPQDFVATLPVRMSRNALPLIVASSLRSSDGYIYRPLCTRTRAAHP